MVLHSIFGFKRKIRIRSYINIKKIDKINKFDKFIIKIQLL